MILIQDQFGRATAQVLRNVLRKLTNGMKIMVVNSMKFWNMDRLNHQVELAMIRYGYSDGVFQIGDRYEIDGMIKLILR